jgi:CheY-like chemotaxis protein
MVLLVEDSEEDYLLLKRAFKRASTNAKLHWVTSSAEARLKIMPDERPPSFILLDLHSPTISASLDFIRWVRAHRTWKRAPIILMTGEIAPTDLDAAYELGINSCLKKPSDFDQLTQMVDSLLQYWCRTVELPVQL